MSVIGPRPGLWNQDLLTAERDKYGVNDVKPGLTGWAQINGRDELEIPDKANLYTLDLICHGVPGGQFFDDYIKYLEKKNHSTVKNFSFREKIEGKIEYCSNMAASLF